MKNPVIKNRFLSLFIICGSILFSTGHAHATVADGVYAYEKGNYKQARIEWLPYAALGNPNALYNLGQLHRMGRGVEIDNLKAKSYYLRAADKGHVGAQRNLGTLYYFGRIGDVDYTKAINWLTKAAINGDARSQLMVGTMYYNGKGEKKNNIQAYAWIMLASKNGLKNATSTLSKLSDIMTPQQITQAKELAPNMISRQLSPDDVGLMVKQQNGNGTKLPELLTPTLAPTPEKIKPQEVEQAAQVTANKESTPLSPATGPDNFRVQLGSFRTEGSAQKAIDNLKNKLSDIIGDSQEKIEFADLGEKGIFYRLQLSPFNTRADADDLCSRLKEYGQGCYVVKAP